ncbi:MAG TPA: HNH endonuclease [Gemmataceae bacterium]|nr:HNH endonuclease [Gemmataceae bacterium]
MQGFEYPIEPHIRQHGPGGYQDYESYRDWVRDEFMFRCVYCLHREQWYGRGATFNIEHFVPVAGDPHGRLEYANLLYACATCNNAKCNILGVPNPCSVAFADCVRIRDDGQVEALNDAGESLVKKLRLNSEKNVQHRSRWMRILAALQAHQPDLYRESMAFPDDLPDLRTKKSPLNSKPESVGDCCFARRERGELPAIY